MRMGYNSSMKKVFSPHIKLAHALWSQFLSPTDFAIDATCGNGHDTYVLAGLANVVGMDIQKSAIENTAKRLEGRSATLHCMCHSRIDELGIKPKLVVYNLGYLPGGNKALTTELSTTQVSLQKALRMLDCPGALSIMCYPGHAEGAKEKAWLMEWIETLDPKWHVIHYTWEDRSPSLIWIAQKISIAY